MNYTQRVAQDFSAAADHYDDFATLQRAVVDELKTYLPAESGLPVLDAGAGTGYALQPDWLGLDIAEGMCRRAHPSICGDMQVLPFADGSFAGVFSSLAMQWLVDVPAFLREAHRCTRDDGWLLLATLGPGTLTELRQSFTKAGFPVPIPGFHSINVLHHELSSTNWNIDSYEDRRMRLEHFSVSALLHHLKGLGARHKRPASSETLRGKTWLQQLEYHYPRDLNNSIISSWEVVIIKAKKR